MFSHFLSVIKYFNLLISPPFCEGCSSKLRDRTIFCEECFKRINPIVSTNLKITGNLDVVVHAVSNYEQPLKSLILAKHWSNRLGSVQLAELIWKLSNIQKLDYDYLVPIPLHWTRKTKRGFNQAEVIANYLSKQSQKPVLNILKRKYFTKYQAQLTLTERAKNVKDCFEITKQTTKIKNKTIVLIDDLMTTGATIQAAAKVINQLRPKKIIVIVACRVV